MSTAIEIVNEAARRTGDKPLFIPLRAQWFIMFEVGTKDTEYRAYGPRWNENTCYVGRKATLSYGYSGRRMERRVTGVRKLSTFDKAVPPGAREIYPNATHFAAIELRGVVQTQETK